MKSKPASVKPKRKVAQKAARPKRPCGRPSAYKPDLAERILDRLAAGESLLRICGDEGMPARSTVALWVINNVDGFSSKYALARDMGLDVMADEVLEISDTQQEGERIEETDDGRKVIREDMLGHRRLRVDTRKWYLSKLAPKRYGDRVAVDAEVRQSVVVVSDFPAEGAD